MKILAIYSHQQALLPFEKLLLDLGYNVTRTASVNEAKQIFGRCNPTLVIVEMNSAESLGFGMLKFIREEQNLATPVIVLSENITGELTEKCQNLNVDGILVKPVDLQEVSSRIKQLIGPATKSKVVTNSEKITIVK